MSAVSAGVDGQSDEWCDTCVSSGGGRHMGGRFDLRRLPLDGVSG